MKRYDLVVIGTGAGGSVAAHKCRQAGWQVAVIDKRPIGGTCALRGCDPKKVLVGAAEIVDSIRRMEGKGITAGSTINWPELMAFKRTFTDPVPENRVKSFMKAGITVYHGEASFLSENRVQVNNECLEGKHFLIATGATPMPLNVIGSEHVTLSDDFLELEELPETLVFIGGGFISFEFAHIAARAGAKVHIIHRSAQPLKNFDPNLVDLLVKHSREAGIQVHLDTQPKSIEKKEFHYVVHGSRDQEMIQWECSMVVHGAGRVPDLAGLSLEAGNIRVEKRGVSVNEFMQSVSNPLVYAAGDAAASPGLPLTPVASMESYVAADNLLKGNHRKPDYSVMPSVVFTQPKLAIVGLKEESARQQGYEVNVSQIDTSGWYTYKRTNEPYAMVKTVTDKKTGNLLGAHVLGGNADELINHFATAIRFKVPANELKKMIYAYPTSASDMIYLV
jgi:glutathione reductase (NADPH)